MKRWLTTLPVAAAAAVVVVGTGAGVAAAAQAPVLAWSPPSPFSLGALAPGATSAAGAASAAGGTMAGTRLAAARDASGGTWGTAEEVPGTAALNAGPATSFISVSCASAGNCSAGGLYTDSSGHEQAFVVSQVGGTWGTAEEGPGTAALNVGGNAQIDSVSCALAGSCSAGGQYTDGSGHVQAFVVSQVGGVWGKAKEVPGTATLNAGGGAEVTSVSCTAAGSCSAGGYYTDGSGHGQAFVVSQVGGVWGKAKEVPGTAALNSGGYALVDSVSCAAVGSCSAGGYYRDSSRHPQAFVVSQVGGVWGKAKEVPGTATLNADGDAYVSSVSCTAAGSCSAGGGYTDGSGDPQVFVVSQVSGVWGKAKEVPGTATLNVGGNAQLTSVSCAAAGNCSAGGFYADSSGLSQAFVVSRVGGVWGKAEEVPGTAAVNGGGHAGVYSLSCASADNCSAGGTYQDSSGSYQTFVVSRT